MEQTKLLEAQMQARRIYNALGEVADLSKQIAEALDRNDPMAVKVLLAMREEPIMTAQLAREALQQMIGETENNQRLRELLNGAEAKTSEETGLAGQVAMNARLLAQVQEMDRAVSKKITRDKSVYEIK